MATPRDTLEDKAQAALRAIGKRNAELRTAATELARRLTDATEPTPRWLGKTALRDLAR